MGLAVAEGAERIEVAPHRVLVVHPLGNLHQAGRLVGDVFGLVGLPGHHPVPDLDPTDRAAHSHHDSQVAVSHPPGIYWGSGDMFGPLVVASVGPDLQGAHPGPDPDFVRLQIAGVQGMLFDAQVSGTAKHGDFHGGSFEFSGWVGCGSPGIRDPPPHEDGPGAG